MRRPALVALLVAACLAALGSHGSAAQVIDSDACQQSCHEQQSVCVGACAAHRNPVECEAQCRDERLDWLKQCPSR
jgi:hypothetical protein